MNDERKHFLFDVFTTGLEGGIGYWSTADDYHIWKHGADGKYDREGPHIEDLDGFFAVVRELNDDESDYRDEQMIINRSVIQRGIGRVLRKEMNVHDSVVKDIAGANTCNDAGDIDSVLADIIIQAGLLGEVRYG